MWNGVKTSVAPLQLWPVLKCCRLGAPLLLNWTDWLVLLLVAWALGAETDSAAAGPARVTARTH